MGGRETGGGAYLGEPNGSSLAPLLARSLPRPFIASAMLLPEATLFLRARAQSVSPSPRVFGR